MQNTTVNYDLQFKNLTFADIMREGEKWKRERVFFDAKKAFESARRSEARGVSVAFAKSESGAYFVWSGEVTA